MGYGCCSGRCDGGRRLELCILAENMQCFCWNRVVGRALYRVTMVYLAVM